MPTNTQTLTVERVSNGWLARTDSAVYVATTPAEVTDLCQRWVERTFTRQRSVLDAAPVAYDHWGGR